MEIAWFIHALDNKAGHEIVQEFREAAAEVRFPVEPQVTWAQPGQFEEVTLNRVRLWSQENPDGYVLYTHTKGAYTQTVLNHNWRMSMASRLIGPWFVRAAELDEVDAVGLHWLTPEEFADRGVQCPFFGGNFWWARADYLAALPELPKLDVASRFEAEKWIGFGQPRVKNLSPGWPAY